jgi:hypothetical protein
MVNGSAHVALLSENPSFPARGWLRRLASRQFLRWRRYRRTTDLHYAPGPCKNREPKVVQLYNRGHEVQAETKAFRVSYLIRPVETTWRVTFMFAYAGSGPLTHDSFTAELVRFPPARQECIDLVDEIGDDSISDPRSPRTFNSCYENQKASLCPPLLARTYQPLHG